MNQTSYLKLELQNLPFPGEWASRRGGNIVLGNIGTALASATPAAFERGDKTAGLRIAKLAWLSDLVNRKLTSSTQLYPTEAIRIRRWLEGHNVITGENEPNQVNLVTERLTEVTAWMEEHWSEIKRQTANRPNKRSTRQPKKSSLSCETPSSPSSPLTSAPAVQTNPG